MIRTIFYTIIITLIVSIWLLSCGQASSQSDKCTSMWTASEGATGYNFYEDKIKIADVGNKTEYKHLIKPLSRYNVTAFNIHGESGFSNTKIPLTCDVFIWED